MIPIPLILGSIAGLLSLFAAGKNASDSISGGRRGGGMRSMPGQPGNLPQGALQIPKFNPQQMQGLDQILNQGLQGWQQNQPSWAPLEQEARNNWNTQAVPLLAERFGGLGAKRSGAFEGALSGANRQFELGLNAQKQQFGQQNRNQALQALQLGLTSPYESIYKGRQPGFGENLAVSALPALIENAPQLAKMFGDWYGAGSGTTPASTDSKGGIKWW